MEDLKTTELRLAAYLLRQMPAESFFVAKDRWKTELLVFFKSGYDHVRQRLPKAFNNVAISVHTINSIREVT